MVWFFDHRDGECFCRFQCPRMNPDFQEWEINEGIFRHHEPASHLQKNRDHFEDQIDEETLDRFETLFKDMNSIIEDRV